MNLKKRLAVLAALAATVTGTALAGAPAATAQELPGTVTVSNGTQFLIRTHEVPEDNGNSEAWRDAFCTIGAVGNDKYGNKVGITAGHCWGLDLGQYDDKVLEYPETFLVWDRKNLDWKEGGDERGYDPIGYVSFAKDADGNGGGHPGRDYGVITFFDDVQLSAVGPSITQTGIHELPNGTIDSPYVNGRNSELGIPSRKSTPQERVLGTGIFTNHVLVTAGQHPLDSYGHAIYYGRITNNSITGKVGVYQSSAAFQAGDSGGPAIIRDAGVPYPSAETGWRSTGKWAGIVRGVVIGAPPFTFTSSANILADLKSRDIASGEDGSVHGAGLVLTTNGL